MLYYKNTRTRGYVIMSGWKILKVNSFYISWYPFLLPTSFGATCLHLLYKVRRLNYYNLIFTIGDMNETLSGDDDDNLVYYEQIYRE